MTPPPDTTPPRAPSSGGGDDAWTRLIGAGGAAHDQVPLFETALALSRIRRPGVNPGPYRRHMDQLTRDAGAFAGPDPESADLDLRITALRDVVARRGGYGGADDVFDDLDAASITHVIDTRNGLPVALGVLYMEAAERLGWPLSGVNFPGRFLLKARWRGEERLLDPFTGLRAVNIVELRAMLKAMAGMDAEPTPHHFREMTKIDVLLRLQDNIRVRQTRRGDLEGALTTLRAMSALAPRRPALYREMGVIHANLGHMRDAVSALEAFLERGASGEDAYQASLLLQKVRSRLN